MQLWQGQHEDGNYCAAGRSACLRRQGGLNKYIKNSRVARSFQSCDKTMACTPVATPPLTATARALIGCYSPEVLQRPLQTHPRKRPAQLPPSFTERIAPALLPCFSGRGVFALQVIQDKKNGSAAWAAGTLRACVAAAEQHQRRS